MPVLEITNGNGVLVSNAEISVQAVMTYPLDDPQEKERRRNFLVYHLYKAFIDREGKSGTSTVELHACELQWLLSLDLDRTKRDEMLRSEKGFVAGAILRHIETTSRLSPGRASVGNAVRDRIASMKKEADEQEQFANKIGWEGQRLWRGQSRTPLWNTSEAKVREAWSEMKPVAHLYAAEPDWEWTPVKTAGDPSGFLTFLADAEYFRVFGETHFARGQKKHGNSTLDPMTTWKTPDDLVLPNSCHPRGH